MVCRNLDRSKTHWNWPLQNIRHLAGINHCPARGAAIDAALNGKAEILAKPVDSQLLLDTVAAA